MLNPMVFLSIFAFFVAAFFGLSEYLANRSFAAMAASAINTSANSWVSVTLAQSISMGIDSSKLILDINPNKQGAFDYNTAGINVSTNNETGYQLMLSTKTDETSLVGSVDKMPTLTNKVQISSSDQSAFANNSWGYTTQNHLANDDMLTEFSAVKGVSNVEKIRDTDSSATDEITYITIGAKANTDIKADSYTNTLVFTAVANASSTVPEIPKFYTIKTLQEMTPEICAETITPRSDAVKVDSIGLRSDNDHYVPETDVIDIRDNKQYLVRKLADGNCWIVNNLSLASVTQEIILTPENTDINKTVTLPVAQIDAGVNWGDPYGATESEIDSLHIFFDGDPRYGALYNWYTATATSGTYSMDSGTAPYSICPKGFKMPTSDHYNTLLEVYEVDAWSIAGTEQLQRIPLEFSLGGWYDVDTLKDMGRESRYFASDADSNLTVGAFWIFDGFSLAYGQYPKTYGSAVRCIAR